MRIFQVNQDLRETLTYQDLGFPIECCIDDYSLLPQHTLSCHWHYEFEFGMLLSGTLDYYIGGEHYQLQAGDCVFINANTLHMAQQPPDCSDAKMFVFSFSSALLAHDRESVIYKKYFAPIWGKDFPGLVLTHDMPLGTAVHTALHELFTLKKDTPCMELQCISIVSRLWSSLFTCLCRDFPDILNSKHDTKNEMRVKSILFYIHEHFSENITIDQLAQQVNISQTECFRCFKHFVRKSPMVYINEYRLSQAAKQLRETANNITDISLSCGFSNTSYFGKLFRQQYDLSPSQYRKQFKN